MPLQKRAFVSVMIVAVVAGAFLLLGRSKQPTSEYLFGGRSLADQELDSVEIAFSRAGLNGWQRDQSKIKIPTEKRNEYLSALDDSAALPVSLRSTVQQAIDKASLFESTSQRVSRERHAKQQDLGNKLAAFPEIRWASVEHDEGERHGFSGVRTQSASVVVCPEGTSPLPISRIETIREFIRGSYADMQSNDVVVIDTNADPNSCHITDPIAHRQHEEQARLEQEVLEVLQGYGAIRVNAHIELRHVDGNSLTAESQFLTTNTAKSKSSPSEPDLLSELFNRVTRVKANSSKRVKTAIAPAEEPTRGGSGASMTPPDNKPTIGTVHLSIGVPDSYFEATWERLATQNGTASTEIAPGQLAQLQEFTKANILAAVRPAVLARISADAANTVEVYSYPDAENAVAMPLVGDTIATTSGFQSQHWMIVGAVGLFVAAILLSSFLAKPGAKTNPTLGTSSEMAVKDCSDVALADVDEGLTKLVEENPDRAIEVIQAWLTEAA